MGCDFVYYKNDIEIDSFQFSRSIQELHKSSFNWYNTDISEFKSDLNSDISKILEKINEYETRSIEKFKQCRNFFLGDTTFNLKEIASKTEDLMHLQNKIVDQEIALKFYRKQLNFIIENEIDRIYISF